MSTQPADWPAGVSVPPRACDLPYDDGVPLESHVHRLQMNLLIDALDLHWGDRNDVFVGGNMFLYFSMTQTRRNDFRGPDVLIVRNTVRRPRLSWVVWEEDGKAPDVVIELLSESTAKADRGEKKRIYEHVLRVPEYVMFDPVSNDLESYALRDGRYQLQPPDSNGRLRSNVTDLWLGLWEGTHRHIERPWLRWFTSEGEPVPSPEERAIRATERANLVTERANQETERANQETERANQETERANLETERANLEAERAAEAETRALAESQARAALEAEIAQLRARVDKDPR